MSFDPFNQPDPPDDPPAGSSLPSSKLTAAGVGALVAAALGRLLEERYAWPPPPVVVDLAGLLIGLGIGYLVPELWPSPTAVRASIRALRNARHQGA